MRACVTGGNGFIGSFLVEKLLHEGCSVRCLVRKTSNLRWLEDLDIELHYGDLYDPASLEKAVRDTDVVFHLGGVTKGKTEKDFVKGNYNATLNVINACQKSGSESQKLIYISSQAAGGPSRKGEALTEEKAVHPISAYGRSKRMAEEAVLQFSKKRPAAIIRPPSVYGPRDKDFFVLFKNVNKGIVPVPGDGKQQVSIVYISDLVDGIYLAAVNEQADGEIFFISADEAVSFVRLGRIISNVLNKKALIVHVPLRLVQGISLLSVAWSKITGKPPLLNKDKVLEMQQPAWICSNEKAKKLLGFKPKTGVEDGMAATAEWYKKNGWL